jgi:tRNA uridine 5-carboxymethylaminomethyl modification enzyme
MVKKQIEIAAKYEGYIKRQYEAVQKMRELEDKKIPNDIDYSSIPGLSNELKSKLARIEPATIGQANRIPGITQAAIVTLLIAIKKSELAAQAQQNDRQHQR